METVNCSIIHLICAMIDVLTKCLGEADCKGPCISSLHILMQELSDDYKQCADRIRCVFRMAIVEQSEV